MYSRPSPRGIRRLDQLKLAVFLLLSLILILLLVLQTLQS